MTQGELEARWTSILGPSLPRSQWASLKQGEPILVLWSGGNGPHLYLVRLIHDEPYAADCDCSIQQDAHLVWRWRTPRPG